MLPQIKCPVLIIHGDKDEVVDIKNAGILKENLPDGHLVIIEGGDHSLNGDEHLTMIKKNLLQWLIS